MHKGEFRYRKTLCDLSPVLKCIDLPLQGSDQPRGNDIGESFFFQLFDECFEVKSAVGDDTEDVDALSDAFIRIGKESENIVPGGNVPGSVPEMNNILTPIEKRE